MKTALTFCLLCFGALTYNSQAQQRPATSQQVYGKAFTQRKVVAAKNLPQLMAQRDSLAVQVVGQVQEVCQVKGCWMDIRLQDNSVMKVRFQDYAFFVPKTLKGKTVVLNGQAFNQTMSVADQKHYARDAGKPAAAIAAIKAPRQSISFMASGVLVK